MENFEISEEIKKDLLKFAKKKKDLLATYLHYIEKLYKLKPVLFLKEKTIYQSDKELIKKLEDSGKLWRKTSIKIQFGRKNVNANTKKIYICPFTGKVFGDNTHPNPQDAIYDWVSKCPENTERTGGLKTKRFFISEDPKIIQNYIEKRKEPITKEVYSSYISGKIFNSKEDIIKDFKKNHVKYLSLFEVQNQNRFEIEKNFLEFLQNYLNEDKISNFVEALQKHEEFSTYLENWLE